MKRLLIVLLILTSTLLAQNTTRWEVRYYGDSYASSSTLLFAVGSSVSGEYTIPKSLLGIQVDSNWTASGIGFMTYNNIEGTWDPVIKDSATVLEYSIAPNQTLWIPPDDSRLLKKVKFYKVTNGAAVNQATAASGIQITVGD